MTSLVHWAIKGSIVVGLAAVAAIGCDGSHAIRDPGTAGAGGVAGIGGAGALGGIGGVGGLQPPDGTDAGPDSACALETVAVRLFWGVDATPTPAVVARGIVTTQFSLLTAGGGYVVWYDSELDAILGARADARCDVQPLMRFGMAQLGDGLVTGLALDADFLYVIRQGPIPGTADAAAPPGNRSTIYRVALATINTDAERRETLGIVDKPTDHLLVDDQDLYFLTYDASDPKRLQRCSKTDCSAPVSLPFRLAVGQMANRAAPVRALVSDGTHIYGYYDDQGYQQSLRCTKPDCTDAADQKPAVTAVDDRYYYAGGSRRPKASTDTGMIAAGGSSGSVDFVTEANVALADGYAYWLTPDRDHSTSQMLLRTTTAAAQP